MRDEGLDGARDREVDVQPDQGQPVVNRASSSLSFGQVQGRRTIARKLTTHNPELRSSMLQVAASLSDVANVAVKRKAPRSLHVGLGRVWINRKVDGENAKPPRVKKQKLSEPERGG
jgi:hypothetical protein